jgi:formate-dependent nitrite reductase membrane component NrfD
VGGKERTKILKTAGIILLILGLVMTLYTGFTYITKDKVVEVGDLVITKDKEHSVNWQPYLGIGVMIIGGVVLIMSRKKPLTA